MEERARQYGLDLDKLKYNFGYRVGIIRSKVPFPAQIRGNENHPETYDFPIQMKLISDWMSPIDKKKE